MIRLPFLLLLFAATPAFGASIERLVMPGELIQGHAKYEDKCESCHEKFAKTGQNALCRNCHEEVDKEIAADQGFHGRLQNAQTAPCRGCHTDHKGRDADVVPLDRENFDHRRTDFALKGAHLRVACNGCHEKGKKWREAPTECVACHKSDDRHQGRLGKACADCHESASWRDARFDHKKTKFALDGGHTRVACATCHPSERYKDTPKECPACHRINDVHGGRYGGKCADCHSAKEWKKPRFNHDKTRFKLEHRHAEIACDACHTGDLYKDKAPLDCNGCHRNDDIHRSKNGPRCDSCHTTREWKKNKFDHTAKTKFPLRSSHTELACESCHKGDVYKVKLATDCHSCHQPDDRHAGELGKKCESCHNERGWGKEIRFDHDLVRFPLIGLHATAPCEACHLTATYKGTTADCVECHKADDKHEQRLGLECARCHSPNGWPLWKFNHDNQTDYELVGRHAGLDCLACHREPRRGKLELRSTCVDCHRQDDIHFGRFGQRCERCHTAESFKETTLGKR